MSYRVTGIGAIGLSINWEKVPGDKDVARRVIAFLEDRRILFVDHHAENEMYCVRSANAAREFLTDQLAQTKAGKHLEASLKDIRAAFRHFVDIAGPDGQNFQRWHYGHTPADPFSLALGELRAIVGYHVELIAYYYGLEIEDELAAILPTYVVSANAVEEGSE